MVLTAAFLSASALPPVSADSVRTSRNYNWECRYSFEARKYWVLRRWEGMKEVFRWKIGPHFLTRRELSLSGWSGKSHEKMNDINLHNHNEMVTRSIWFESKEERRGGNQGWPSKSERGGRVVLNPTLSNENEGKGRNQTNKYLLIERRAKSVEKIRTRMMRALLQTTVGLNIWALYIKLNKCREIMDFLYQFNICLPTWKL